MHNISREARVGVVAALGIFCLVFIMVFLRALKPATAGDIYYVVFEDAGRIVKGTDVNMAGVRVGEVDDVKLTDTNQAQVDLIIGRKYEIHKSYQFKVSKGTLIGQTAVEIIPVGGKKGSGPVIHPNNPDEPIIGISSPSIESVIPEINDTLRTIRDTTSKMQKLVSDPEVVHSFKHTAQDIHATAESIKKIVGDPQMAALIRRSLTNVERASARAVHTADSLAQLSANLREVIGENRGEVKNAFAQMGAAAKNMEIATANLRTSLDDLKVKERSDEAFASFKKTLANFDETSEKLKKLAADPQLTEDLKKMVATARETTDNLRKATDSLKDLVGDEQIRADLKTAAKEGKETVTTAKEALTNVRSASEDLTAAMKSARAAAERVDKLLNIKTPSAKSALDNVRPDVTIRHVGGDGRTLADLNLRVGGQHHFGYLGLSDIGNDGVRFSLQQGIGFGGGTAARFGLYRSRVGFGLDQRLGTSDLALNVFDPDHAKYSAWLSTPLTKKTEFMLGMERDRKRQDLFGAGIRLRPF